MSLGIQKLNPNEFPSLLGEISDPPKELYIEGEYPNEENHKFLCIVGSRKYSSYGKEVTKKLISELSGYPIVIVSGLALGIDAIAHNSAISNGLKTVAVPGSGLDRSVLYPRTNVNLAEKILSSGGALLSEFEPTFRATTWSFPQRNRIMAGISHAVIVIEAEDRSGTLITSRLATEYNRDVFTVPGSIFHPGSYGPHMLISKGAATITCGEDILNNLGIDTDIKKPSNASRLFESLSDDEKIVVNLLDASLTRDELVAKLDIPIHKINIVLSSLEIKGVIEEKLGKIWIK